MVHDHSAFKFLPVIGKYAVESFERKLSHRLLEKWKFPTAYRERFEWGAFKGDGSRGGPDRREMTAQEREMFDSALAAVSTRNCKI